MAVYFAMLNPGDTILSMSLADGGHLSHGHKLNFSGRFFNIVPYGVSPETEQIDYDQVEKLAAEHKPRMIVAGASAYSRIIDFKRLRAIADSVGAYLTVDMAHIAGLVAAGFHPSPVPYADFVTTTTHKTLRGPRGGLVLCKEAYAKELDKTVFPGLQGGPLPQIIVAKAVAFQEALSPDFARYAQQVVANAKAMADTLMQRGFSLTTQGTDTHVMLVDLRAQNLTGKQAAEALEQAGLVCNKNSVPGDTQPPSITSGIRLGTPSLTTRGFKEDDCRVVARIIADVLDTLQKQPDHIATMIKVAQDKVRELTLQFPINTKGGL